MSCCKFCGRPDENNPGDYYHYHDCWSDDVLRRLEAAKARALKAGAVGPTSEIRKLERELEQARYVGD